MQVYLSFDVKYGQCLFIAIYCDLKEEEKLQISNLNLHLKQLEKEEQTKPKVRIRKKKITKIKAERNKIDTKK